MSKFWKTIILFSWILLIGSILFVSACQTPSQSFVETNYKNSELMLIDLIQYIEQDKTLPDLEKKIRIKSVKEWLKLNKIVHEKMKED